MPAEACNFLTLLDYREQKDTSKRVAAEISRQCERMRSQGRPQDPELTRVAAYAEIVKAR